jgi:RNA polymerase sigma-70 factor (ECF subfamily)
MSAQTNSPITDATSASGQPTSLDGGAERLLGHAEWLKRLIQRRLRPLDCGDEVLQEVLVAASLSRKIPEAIADQEPWLARVAIRQCAMALRSWGRRQRREAEYVASKNAAEDRLADDPIYWLMMCERRDFVRDQLARLEPHLRELLVLKYVHGCTYKEIATRLKMDVSAVEYRLSEARKTMRKRLIEAGCDEGHNDD